MKKKEVINYIVKWLNNYSKESNTNGFVIGLSGGIDSSVTAELLAKTNKKVLYLSLPIYQSKRELERVSELENYLKNKYSNIEFLEIDLSNIFDTFKKSNEVVDNKEKLDLTLANSRARLRMTTLYYYAGLNDYLVVGTGNKVEDFGIGFFTKYGDGGVDISPIADLLKSEVYELGKELNLPNSIIKSIPTDGLFGDDRTDEMQIGASYDELEWAMNFNEDKNNLTEREKEILNIYEFRNKSNKHKMIPIPICKLKNEKNEKNEKYFINLINIILREFNITTFK